MVQAPPFISPFQATKTKFRAPPLPSSGNQCNQTKHKHGSADPLSRPFKCLFSHLNPAIWYDLCYYKFTVYHHYMILTKIRFCVGYSYEYREETKIFPRHEISSSRILDCQSLSIFRFSLFFYWISSSYHALSMSDHSCFEWNSNNFNISKISCEYLEENTSFLASTIDRERERERERTRLR